MHPTGPGHYGVADRGILALVNPERLRRILTKMLDENEFLSPYGIRALSRFHKDHPHIFHAGGQEHRVDYLPAESDSGMFGGNSNWRGPIWMPVNVMLIRALLNFYAYYGDNFKIECPTGSGRLMNLFEVSKEIADRLTRIFTARRTAAGGPSTAAPRCSRPIRTGATTFCSTNTSTATTGQGSAPAIRPAGPGSSPSSFSCTACLMPDGSSRRARRARSFRSADAAGGPATPVITVPSR